jgi:hypothetical protein
MSWKTGSVLEIASSLEEKLLILYKPNDHDLRGYNLLTAKRGNLSISVMLLPESL